MIFVKFPQELLSLYYIQIKIMILPFLTVGFKLVVAVPLCPWTTIEVFLDADIVSFKLSAVTSNSTGTRGVSL